MKTLYLLRHAKSSWKTAGLADIDRPLNKRGQRAAKAIGEHMRERKIALDQVLCSPSQRTRETLERLERALPASLPVRVEKAVYLAEAPLLLRRVRRLSDSLASVMIVGHNPGLEELAAILADGTEGADTSTRERMAEKFPTGALATLSADIDHWHDLAAGGAHLRGFFVPQA